MRPGTRVAVDIGGTFTDLVRYDPESGDLVTAKVLTDQGDRARGVIAALRNSGSLESEVEEFIHGTTAGTNAVIEGKGAITALLTTRGFRDVLELMRGDRPLPVYDLDWRKPDPLIPRHLRFEVDERLDSSGAVIDPLDEDGLRDLLNSDPFEDVEAVAICFLHAFLNPAHEIRAAEIVAEELPGVQVSLASVIDPEVREYERSCTVSLDAMLKPLMSSYLGRLSESLDRAGVGCEPKIMLANAGVLPVEGAARRPVFTLNSGPAGGIVGARLIGEALGRPNLITADMGGTSFDVCAIVDGEPSFRSEGYVRWGLPFRIPHVDIGTIGAGGGSIGWADRGGLLRVGPESTGSDPGPVCYGLGGDRPTVVDAFATLGYFEDGAIGGGAVEIDTSAAREAFADLGRELGLDADQTALGTLEIALANMVAEIRKHSVERGRDPRQFALFPFGGAGSMLAGLLAHELEMPEVIVPPHAGVFSAWGMLGADLRFDVQRTFHGELDSTDVRELESTFVDGEQEVAEALPEAAGDLVITRQVSLRYSGQRHELRVPIASPAGPEALADARSGFDRLHDREYGHSRPEATVEVRGLQVTGSVRRERPILRCGGDATPQEAFAGTRRVRLVRQTEAQELPVHDRTMIAAGHRVEGPALLVSPDSTVVVYPGQQATVHETGCLVMGAAS